MSEMTISWAVLLGLGAFHGINPGMGWLFAVALGMQERRRGAVFSALLPLARAMCWPWGGDCHCARCGGAVIPLTGCAGWSPAILVASA